MFTEPIDTVCMLTEGCRNDRKWKPLTALVRYCAMPVCRLIGAAINMGNTWLLLLFCWYSKSYCRKKQVEEGSCVIGSSVWWRPSLRVINCLCQAQCGPSWTFNIWYRLINFGPLTWRWIYNMHWNLCLLPQKVVDRDARSFLGFQIQIE